MQISRNMVNWPKSNNWVLVGIWLSSASRNHLATFCKPLVHFACLRLFSAIVHFIQGFLRRFRGPIRVPRIRENYHRVPKIRENRVPRIREIGFLQIQTGFLTFSLKTTLIQCVFIAWKNSIGMHANCHCTQGLQVFLGGTKPIWGP